MIGLLAIIASGLLSFALWWTDGHLEVHGHPTPWGVAAVVLVLLLSLAGALGRWPSRLDDAARRLTPAALVTLVAVQLFWLFERWPARHLAEGFPRPIFKAGMVAVAVLASSYLWKGRLLRPALKFPYLLAAYVLVALWIIQWSPRPFIDVWYFEERAADLLLHGQNPYAAEYPNIYRDTVFFGPGLVKDGRVLSHTYPPLSVLLTVPGKLLGDVRFSMLAAAAAAAAFVVAALRRLGAQPGHVVELAAVGFLFHSRAFFIIEQAWSEPFIALGAAVSLYALARGGERWLVAGLTGFVSAKQYGLLFIPALLRSGALRLRTLAAAAALSALVVLPFLLWDPAALFRGMVAYQLKLSFRPDSLSVPALAYWWNGAKLPPGLGFTATAIVSALVLWRVKTPAPLERVAMGGAATFLAFFAFHKQAFANYYWFVGLLLAVAAGADLLRARSAAVGEVAPAPAAGSTVPARAVG